MSPMPAHITDDAEFLARYGAERPDGIGDCDLIACLLEGQAGHRRVQPQSFRTTRQGVPTAITPAGMSRVTTLLAPMMESSPTETPGER
jgi:hypothetical protein